MVNQGMTFAVIYRWRVHPGMEESFTAAWETLTRGIREGRGGLGSRLHRAEDGTWVAYAQWPDRATWANMQEMGSLDAAASADLKEAVAESFDPILLEPVRDLLVEG